MKRYNSVLMVLLVLMFSVSLASAAFDIPHQVYRIDQSQQAMEQARNDNKQIVFFYSNKDTNCPLASRASISIMQRSKYNAVIVYVGREGWAKAPRIVREAINSPEAGRFIPKTIVVDSGITKVLSIIPYEKAGK